MTSVPKIRAALAAATVALLASPHAAHAQAAVGGGGGGFNQVYNWFMTNVWAGIVLLGVVVVGLMFWLGRAAVYVIALGAVGGLIVKFAPDIAAFFS